MAVTRTEQARRMAVVVGKALMYEAAWSRYAHPSTSPGLDDSERLLEKATAHQTLLDAVRQLREVYNGTTAT